MRFTAGLKDSFADEVYCEGCPPRYRVRHLPTKIESCHRRFRRVQRKHQNYYSGSTGNPPMRFTAGFFRCPPQMRFTAGGDVSSQMRSTANFPADKVYSARKEMKHNSSPDEVYGKFKRLPRR